MLTMSLSTLRVIYSTVSLYGTLVTGKIKQMSLSHNNYSSVYDIKGAIANISCVLLVQITWKIM